MNRNNFFTPPEWNSNTHIMTPIERILSPQNLMKRFQGSSRTRLRRQIKEKKGDSDRSRSRSKLSPNRTPGSEQFLPPLVRSQVDGSNENGELQSTVNSPHSQSLAKKPRPAGAVASRVPGVSSEALSPERSQNGQREPPEDGDRLESYLGSPAQAEE